MHVHLQEARICAPIDQNPPQRIGELAAQDNEAQLTLQEVCLQLDLEEVDPQLTLEEGHPQQW